MDQIWKSLVQCICYVSVSSHFYTLAILCLCFAIPSFYILSCRMKVKECRIKGIYNIGFTDPHVINENSIIKWPNQTENIMFRVLDRQHTCTFIMLLHNFRWVLWLFFHPFNFIISISNISSIYEYQQPSLDIALYREWSGPIYGVWHSKEAKRIISKPHNII